MDGLPNIVFPSQIGLGHSILDYARFGQQQAQAQQEQADKIDKEMRRRKASSILADVQAGKVDMGDAARDPDVRDAIKEQMLLEAKLDERAQQNKYQDTMLGLKKDEMDQASRFHGDDLGIRRDAMDQATQFHSDDQDLKFRTLEQQTKLNDANADLIGAHKRLYDSQIEQALRNSTGQTVVEKTAIPGIIVVRRPNGGTTAMHDYSYVPPKPTIVGKPEDMGNGYWNFHLSDGSSELKPKIPGFDPEDPTFGETFGAMGGRMADKYRTLFDQQPPGAAAAVTSTAPTLQGSAAPAVIPPLSGPDAVYPDEQAARRAGKKRGDVINVINPKTGKPSRAVIVDQ